MIALVLLAAAALLAVVILAVLLIQLYADLDTVRRHAARMEGQRNTARAAADEARRALADRTPLRVMVDHSRPPYPPAPASRGIAPVQPADLDRTMFQPLASVRSGS